MKRGIMILFSALCLGLLAFGIGYWWCGGRSHHLDEHTHRELAWLEQEFQLTPGQSARIAEIHNRFIPVCDELCMNVAAVSAELASLIATNRTLTPEIEHALREAALLHRQSRQAVVAHLFEISAEMSPVQADRYLSMMMPQVLDVPYNSNSDSGAH